MVDISERHDEVSVVLVRLDAVGGREHVAAADEGAPAERGRRADLQPDLPRVLVGVGAVAIDNAVGCCVLEAAVTG